MIKGLAIIILLLFFYYLCLVVSKHPVAIYLTMAFYNISARDEENSLNSFVKKKLAKMIRRLICCNFRTLNILTLDSTLMIRNWALSLHVDYLMLLSLFYKPMIYRLLA